MKRIVALSLVLLLMVSALAACGSDTNNAPSGSSSGSSMYGDAYYAGDGVILPESSSSGLYATEPIIIDEPSTPLSVDNAAPTEYDNNMTDVPAENTPPAVVPVNPVESYGLKIIYTASLSVETLEYDQSYQSILTELAACGGYISYSDQQTSYNGARYANFEFRIPADNYNRFLTACDGFGTVLRRSDTSQDVTSSYTDLEARITALQTQEIRLLELISQAETLEALLLLEDKLTSVRYEIEGYTAAINQYDDLIAFCTVGLSLTEVAAITPPTSDTFWSQVWEAILTSLRTVGQFLQLVLFALIYLLPFFAIGFGLFLLIRRLTRKQRARRNANRILQQAVSAGAPIPTPVEPAISEKNSLL